MDIPKMPNTATAKKGGIGKTALNIARVAVVYFLVSMFFNILNPIALGAAEDYSLKQIFSDIGTFTSELTTNGFSYYEGMAMQIAAYVLLIGMVVLCIALVLSILDGTPKKVAVVTMTVAFFAIAAASAMGGIFSVTLGAEQFVTARPYSFLATAIFAAAAICCIVSLCSKSCAHVYDKNVDPNTLGGKLTGYFTGSIAEIKKIVWPDKQTVLKNTGVVLLFILVLGTVIWLLDLLWTFLFNLLLG